jgi:hypothetical protein
VKILRDILPIGIAESLIGLRSKGWLNLTSKKLALPFPFPANSHFDSEVSSLLKSLAGLHLQRLGQDHDVVPGTWILNLLTFQLLNKEFNS